MADCNDISVKNFSGGNVYLKGKITGLTSSEEYCLYYYDILSGFVNMPSNVGDYTYFTGGIWFDLAANGCYAPQQGNALSIVCRKVEGNCETGQAFRCSTTIDTSSDNCYGRYGTKCLHIGVDAEFSSDALCLDLPIDSDYYDPTTPLYGGVIYDPSLQDANIKIYIGGEGLWTKYLSYSYSCDAGSWGAYASFEQNTPGWFAKVQFDFCDGNTVIRSRSTWWRAIEAGPFTNTTQTDEMFRSDWKRLYPFYYQMSTVYSNRCYIRVVTPWTPIDNPVVKQWAYIGDVLAFSNPSNTAERYVLKVDSIDQAAGPGDPPYYATITAKYYNNWVCTPTCDFEVA